MEKEILSAPKERIQQIYRDGCDDVRDALISLFGAQQFITSMKEWEDFIIPRVGSFEEACVFAGEDPAADKFTTGEPDEISYKKGKFVCAVLNGSWVRDWNNANQQKWEAFLKWGGSGFRFFDSRYVHTIKNSSGGARLRLCSPKIAEHFATKFAEMMQPYWV